MPTSGTPAVLRLEQASLARRQRGVAAQSAGPVAPVAIIRAGSPSDLNVPTDGRAGVGSQAHARRFAEDPVVRAPGMPVPPDDPAAGFLRVPSAAPAEQPTVQSVVQPAEDGLAHDRGMVARPAPNPWVERADQLTLRGLWLLSNEGGQGRVLATLAALAWPD